MRIKKPSVLLSVMWCLFLMPLSHVFAEEVGKIQSVISNVSNSVVMIYYKNENGYSVPLGSGFLISADGFIATANHVVRRAGDEGFELTNDKNGKVIKAELRFRDNLYCKDNNEKQYRVIVKTESNLQNTNAKNAVAFDYAILKIVDPERRFNYLEVGDYSKIQVGDDVIFAGFPLSRPNLIVQRGMVSAKYPDYAEGQKEIDKQIKVNALADLLMVDGSINRGNSGGPVVDVKTGKVVGVVNTKYMGITPKLEELRKLIKEKKGVSIVLGGVDPKEGLLELINVIDTSMNVGLGGAVSIEYLKKDPTFQEALR